MMSILLTPDQQQTANENFAQAVTRDAPVDSGALPPLADTLQNSLPPLGDTLKIALPPLGGR
jgi:hypothetical protein